MLVGLLIVAAVAGLLFVSLYNRLVPLRVRAENASSDIDVQLKLRADLVPNLISTAKGHAAHERKTLDPIAQAKTKAVAAQSARPQIPVGSPPGSAMVSLGRLTRAGGAPIVHSQRYVPSGCTW